MKFGDFLLPPRDEGVTHDIGFAIEVRVRPVGKAKCLQDKFQQIDVL
jgi:hypothetical protein